MIGVVALNLTKRPGEQWARAASYYGYDPLGNLETTGEDHDGCRVAQDN
jgi:hypothetical protein